MSHVGGRHIDYDTLTLALALTLILTLRPW